MQENYSASETGQQKKEEEMTTLLDGKTERKFRTTTFAYYSQPYRKTLCFFITFEKREHRWGISKLICQWAIDIDSGRTYELNQDEKTIVCQWFCNQIRYNGSLRKEVFDRCR